MAAFKARLLTLNAGFSQHAQYCKIATMQVLIIVAALVASMLSASAQDCRADPFLCAKQRVDQQYTIRRQGRSWYDSRGNTWIPMGKWNVYGSHGQVCTKMGKTIYCRGR